MNVSPVPLVPIFDSSAGAAFHATVRFLPLQRDIIAEACPSGEAVDECSFEVVRDDVGDPITELLWRRSATLVCRFETSNPVFQVGIAHFDDTFLCALSNRSLSLFNLASGDSHVIVLPEDAVSFIVLPSVIAVQCSSSWFLVSGPYSTLKCLYLSNVRSRAAGVPETRLSLSPPPRSPPLSRDPSPSGAPAPARVSSDVVTPKSSPPTGVHRRSSLSTKIMMRTPSPRFISPMQDLIGYSPPVMHFDAYSDLFMKPNTSRSASIDPSVPLTAPEGDVMSSMEFRLMPDNCLLHHPHHKLLTVSEWKCLFAFKVKKAKTRQGKAYFEASKLWDCKCPCDVRTAFLLDSTADQVWVLDVTSTLRIIDVSTSATMVSVPNVLSAVPWIEKTALVLSWSSDAASLLISVLNATGSCVVCYSIDPASIRGLGRNAAMTLVDAVDDKVSIHIHSGSSRHGTHRPSVRILRFVVPRPSPSAIGYENVPSLSNLLKMSSSQVLLDSLKDLSIKEVHAVYEALKQDHRLLPWMKPLALRLFSLAVSGTCARYVQYYMRDIPSIASTVPYPPLDVATSSPLDSVSLHHLDHFESNFESFLKTARQRALANADYESYRWHLGITKDSHEDKLLQIALVGVEHYPLFLQCVVISARCRIRQLLESCASQEKLSDVHNTSLSNMSVRHPAGASLLADLARKLSCGQLAACFESAPSSVIPAPSATNTLFGRDTRLAEARRMLQCFDDAGVASLRIFRLPDQFVAPEDHEPALDWTVSRMRGASIGRALQMLLSIPLDPSRLHTSQIPLPELKWAAVHPTSGAVVTCTSPPPEASWALFHHGAGGMFSLLFPSSHDGSSLSSQAHSGSAISSLAVGDPPRRAAAVNMQTSLFIDDVKRVDRAWIWFHAEPINDIPQRAVRGGVLLALGLRGGLLRSLSRHDLYRVLAARDNHMTSGLLVGSAFSREGEGDTDQHTARMLSMHIPALLPAEADVAISPPILSSALFALGILYKKCCHRIVGDVLLQEIARGGPASLTAGAALGLVFLSRGAPDKEMMHSLHTLFTGGAMRSSLPKLYGRHSSSSASRPHGGASGGPAHDDLRQNSALVPTHETAHGAILALGVMYAGTQNGTVAEMFRAPTSCTDLVRAAPDTMLLRMACRALVQWPTVEPSADWVFKQVSGMPLLVDCLPREFLALVSPSILHRRDGRGMLHASSSQVLQGMADHAALSVRFALDGCALALGIKFASTRNEACRTVLLSLASAESDVALLALSLVCCGSGDPVLLKRIRKRILQCPNNTLPAVRDRRMRLLHTALGLLFLAGGRLVVRTGSKSGDCAQEVTNAVWLLYSMYMPLGEECPPATHAYMRTLAAADIVSPYPASGDTAQASAASKVSESEVAECRAALWAAATACSDPIQFRFLRGCLEHSGHVGINAKTGNVDARALQTPSPTVLRMSPTQPSNLAWCAAVMDFEFSVRLAEQLRGVADPAQLITYWVSNACSTHALACICTFYDLPFPSEVQLFAAHFAKRFSAALKTSAQSAYPVVMAAVLRQYARFDFWICSAIAHAVLRIIA